MSMIYVIGNDIDSGTLSEVSSEDSIYPKENMYNLAQSMPWRMTSNAGHLIIDLGVGFTEPMCFGIMNHNLLGTSVADPFVFTISADDDAPNWGDPAWGPITIPYHTHNIFYTIPSAGRNHRWWRIDWDDPDNSALEFGEIILKTYSIFSMTFWWPYREGLDFIVDENVTHYGRRHRVKRAKKKSFKIDYDGVTDVNLVSEVEAFFESLDGDNPFIFVPEADETDSWYMECLNNLDAQRLFIDRSKFSLKLEEQSRGIILG